MPLQTQLIPFVFDKGLNTKNDPKGLQPAELTALENAVRRKSPTWQKRNGGEALPDRIIGSTKTVTDADALLVFNDELLLAAKQSIYGVSESAGGLVDKGPAVSLQVDSFDVTKNSYEQTIVDQAIAAGVAIVAWEDSRGGVRYTVYECATRTQLVSDALANVSGTRPRCISFNGLLFLFYAVSGTLYGRSLAPGSPTPLGTEVSLTTNLNTSNPHYDVIAHDAFILLAYNQQSTAQIGIMKLSDALASLATAAIAEAATDCLTLIRDSMSRTFTAWHNGSGIRAAVHSVALGVIAAAGTIDNTSGTVTNVTGYALPDGSGVRLYYEFSAAAASNRFIRQNTVTSLGVAGTSAVFLRSVGLAWKAFAKSPDTTDRGFVGVVHDSTLQSTFFLARNDGFLVAKLRYGIAGGVLARTLPAGVSISAPEVYSVPILTKNPLVSADDSSFLSLRGVSVAEFDFSNARTFAAAQLGDNLHISGGIISTYDGQSVIEHGFHLYPEDVTLVQGTGGSLTVTGVYSYKVCYEWTDAKGQIHRSAPSVPLQITLTGSNNRVTLTVPTLRLTEKRGTRTAATIVVYRTENIGQPYYQASSSTSPTYNDTTADSVSIIDNLDDVTLIGKATLYTEGGVLENIGAPAATLVWKHKRRLFFGPLEDGSIGYSKERGQGAPVEINDAFVIPFDREDGLIKAGISLGDTIVLFKTRGIWAVTGDGPDPTGANGVYSEPQELAKDVGAVDGNAIAKIPGGVVFKSEKGFYLLGPQANSFTGTLVPTYIGAQVEKWNYTTATSAVVHADQRELRITTLEGPTLVYHYLEDQWSVFTNYAANDAVLWKGRYVHIKRLPGSAALAVVENDSFLDLGSKISLVVETGWISLAGIQGFQRVRRALVLGEFKSRHKVKVTVWYDFSDAAFEEHILDSSDLLAQTTYGSSSPYGAEPTYGGLPFPYLFRLGLARQKSTAVKLRIEDVTQEEAPYESFNTMGLAFEAGVKKGAWKTHAAATA